MTAAAAIALAGCEEERTLTAEEFVNQVREEGVEVTLGAELPPGESAELREITLVPLPGLEASDVPGRENARATGVTGTLYVFDDGDGAEAELAGCRASADLTCFRAGNIVALFPETGIEVQRLGAAIRRLGEE